jgi:hemerythrin-like domain-containing protein
MTATETLRHEHEIILLVLGSVESRVMPPEEADLDADWLGKLVDFCRNFVDRCHHAKEERHLIPKMEQRGIPSDHGAICFTLQEHEQGRELVRAIAEALPAVRAGDAGAIASTASGLQAYVELLEAHIKKENEVLFPMADEVFTPEDQAELEVAFERVETEELGEGVHEKYHQLAHELAGHPEER